jgi:hypothetical protein
LGDFIAEVDWLFHFLRKSLGALRESKGEKPMKTSVMGPATRLRVMILGFIFLLLAAFTVWAFVMVAANLSPLFEAIGKTNGFNWWTPILPQMKIVIT